MKTFSRREPSPPSYRRRTRTQAEAPAARATADIVVANWPTMSIAGSHEHATSQPGLDMPPAVACHPFWTCHQPLNLNMPPAAGSDEHATSRFVGMPPDEDPRTIPAMQQDAHRKRCQRFNEPGHAHALTFSCFRRQAFLARDRSRRWFLDALRHAVARHRFDLWAFVAMPDHVHVLVFPTMPAYSISRFLFTLKKPVTNRALAFVQAHAPRFLERMADRQPDETLQHRFWQRGGGYDQNLTEPRAIRAWIEYVHANPVRRGLCAKPTDWPWSSAREYDRRGSGPLPIAFHSLPPLPG